MKKYFKLIFSLWLLIFLSFSITLSFKAWNPPTVNKYNLEEVEFRSVWVCSVSNMDVDKQMGTSPEAIKAWQNQYLAILNNSKEMGMNAIIFQVRPCNDAFYPSKYNPWSEFLVGYGVDPGWDPLEWMIEVTHEAGLEYHAWLNPYRTSTSTLSYLPTEKDPATSSSYWADYDMNEAYQFKQTYFNNLADILRHNNNVVDNPIMETGETLDHEIVFGSEAKFVLNPALPSTIELLNNTISELIENYDIDGIHFDDYFYPDDISYKGTNNTYKNITFSSEPYYDMLDYNNYVENGGTLDIYNYRRENVNNLIHSLSDIIRENNKTDDYICAFGISPAARWAPAIEACPVGSPRAAEGGENSGCNNYYSYSDLYADTRKWVKEDWIDYILPQAYTYLGSSTSGIPSGNYSSIVEWWSKEVVGTKCRLYIGTPAYQIATWTSGNLATKLELYYQIRYCQTRNFNTDGFVMFRYKSLISGTGANAMSSVTQSLWKIAALTPCYETYTYPHLDKNPVIKELKKNGDGTYTIIYDLVDDAKAYGISEDGVIINRVLGKDNQMEFAVSENKVYKLVTYGKDNNMVDNPITIDLSTAIVNAAPTVSFDTELEKEYPFRSDISLKFTTSDKENDSLTYVLKLKYDTYEYIISKGDVNNNVISYTYTAYSYAQKGMYFEIVVSDGYNDVTYTTSSFDLVEKKEEITPPIEDDPIDKEKEEETKKKGCKKSSLISSIIALSSLLYFVLRRKK